MSKELSKELVACINNQGYPASLERRKICVSLRDPFARKKGLMRIIDESGDDYLFPQSYFHTVALPASLRKAVLEA